MLSFIYLLLWWLINHHSSKILFEYSRSFFKLFGGIFFYVFQLVFLLHGFVLVYAQCMVRQDFYPLNHLILSQCLSQSADILFEIAVSGH